MKNAVAGRTSLVTWCPVLAEPWFRRIRFWSVLGLLLAVGLRVLDILCGSNFHVVWAGQCYRGAQPSPDELSHIVRSHDIHTVVNLRGVQKQSPWFQRENQSARELGVKLVHIGMWSNALPEVDEFRNLVRTLSEDPGPFFLHCQHGCDRTGLGSALYLLLRTDVSLEEARKQLGIYFGHLSNGRASCQDLLLDRYAAWLRRQELVHAAPHLRRWALEVYDGKLEE